jgi:hypothetical protein
MRMRLAQDVEQEDDGRRDLTVEVFVHERRGGVAELYPAGVKWLVRCLRGDGGPQQQGQRHRHGADDDAGASRGRRIASAKRAWSRSCPQPPRSV